MFRIFGDELANMHKIDLKNGDPNDIGFKKLGSKLSHQKTWKKSVFETYKDASINLNWTAILKKECNKLGIEFFSTPYSFQLVDHINKYIK